LEVNNSILKSPTAPLKFKGAFSGSGLTSIILLPAATVFETWL